MPMLRVWAAFLLVLTSMNTGLVAASPIGDVGGCSSGWGQLLPPSQRQQAMEARGCTSGEPSTFALADQLSAYAVPVTHGPLGPLASPSKERGAPPAARSPGRQPGRVDAHSAGFRDLRPVTLAPLIDGAARRHDIDPLLLHAIARVESRHQPGAISHAGAHGLMQVIVPTARRFGVDSAQQLHHPATNLEVSARYLKTLQRRFGNDLTLVLAAYNAGEGAVEKYGRRIPPYRETQGYVRKVLAEYQLLRQVSLRRGDGVLARIVAEAEL